MIKKFAIFGDPVEHSLSPKMHNSAFKELNFNGIYNKIHLKDGTKLKETFLKENLLGANITVPHKEAAFRACDKLDEFAKKVGAVNTIVLKENLLYGYNTDAPGFLKSIEKFKDISTILIIGAGGTTQATSKVLKDANYKVTILNRSQARLESFIKDGFECYNWDSFDTTKSYDLIVNMTSAGLSDTNLPAPKDIVETLLKNATAAVDIIYGKITPFLELAIKANLPISDGKEMLINQGVLAFDYFTNHQYNLDDIEKIMKAALAE